MRISLRFFLVACVLACLLVAWGGLMHQESSTLATLKGNNERRWESFSNEGGHPGDDIGGIRFDGNGNCVSAQVRDLRGLEILLEKEGVCRTLPSLSIFGPEAFAEFDPRSFPALERVSISGIAIDESTLQRLQPMERLRELNVSDFIQNPVSALHVLRDFKNLQELTIRSDQIPSLDSFPDLPQLNLLTVDCAGLPDESVEVFTRRFSKCLVSVNVRPYPPREAEDDEASSR